MMYRRSRSGGSFLRRGRRGRCAGGAYTAFGAVHLFKIIINGGAGVCFGNALLALKSVSVGAEGAYTAFGEVYQTLKSINGGAGVCFGKALLALRSVAGAD